MRFSYFDALRRRSFPILLNLSTGLPGRLLEFARFTTSLWQMSENLNGMNHRDKPNPIGGNGSEQKMPTCKSVPAPPSQSAIQIGDPNGNRTHATAVKGRCPNR